MTEEYRLVIQFSSPIWFYTYFAKRNTFHLECFVVLVVVDWFVFIFTGK